MTDPRLLTESSTARSALQDLLTRIRCGALAAPRFRFGLSTSSRPGS